MTTITDERMAEIKAGLVGVSEGPWFRSAHLDGCSVLAGPINDRVSVCEAWDMTHAAHIARMDPATVAALTARMEKAEARVKALEKALQPFADTAPSWLDRTPDDCIVVNSHANCPAITLGHIRRARAELEGK